MPKIAAERLEEIGRALFEAAGTPADEAALVMRHIVGANLVGHDSHGVIQIPTYIDRIKAGHIVPGAPWVIVKESPTTTVVDGHWGRRRATSPPRRCFAKAISAVCQATRRWRRRPA
jgi:uncharacterized oxidoreductase